MNDLSTANCLFLMHASILARQQQRVIAKIEPDARHREIRPFDLLGVEPVAIAIIAYQHCIFSCGDDQFPVLEIVIAELSGMLLSESDLVD